MNSNLFDISLNFFFRHLCCFLLHDLIRNNYTKSSLLSLQHCGRDTWVATSNIYFSALNIFTVPSIASCCTETNNLRVFRLLLCNLNHLRHLTSMISYYEYSYYSSHVASQRRASVIGHFLSLIIGSLSRVSVNTSKYERCAILTYT